MHHSQQKVKQASYYPPSQSRGEERDIGNVGKVVRLEMGMVFWD